MKRGAKDARLEGGKACIFGKNRLKLRPGVSGGSEAEPRNPIRLYPNIRRFAGEERITRGYK